jgi:ribosomal protein S18 acetylase RimI-like enzyme
MDENLSLSISQFRGAWRCMCGPAANFAQASMPGMELVFSGFPIAFFNAVILTDRLESSAALGKLGADACAAAAGYGVPWILVLTRETLAEGIDAAATLKDCGLAPLMPLTGMIADDVAPVSKQPAGLELTVPHDDESCAAIVTLNGAAYAMDLGPSMPILGSQNFWKDHFPVVGKVGGQPVSCSTVMMVDGYCYVALVATHPAHQRRGYADAAMRRSLENAVAAKGKCSTVLHASDAGRPVYERMGYETISTHTLFIEEKFLGGH